MGKRRRTVRSFKFEGRLIIGKVYSGFRDSWEWDIGNGKDNGEEAVTLVVAEMED